MEHFKQIEIEFDGIRYGTLQKYTPFNDREYNANEMIFAQDANEQYPADTQMIELRGVKQGIEYFGKLEKPCQWL